MLVNRFPTFEAEFAAIGGTDDDAPAGGDGSSLAKLLASRRFDLLNPPPEPVPVYRLGDATIATAGNLVGIQGQAKGGKSAFVNALLAAAMGGRGDCLGVASANPQGLALIHFDTEQSPADHHRGIVRALQRAVLPSPSPWLRSLRQRSVRIAGR